MIKTFNKLFLVLTFMLSSSVFSGDDSNRANFLKLQDEYRISSNTYGVFYINFGRFSDLSEELIREMYSDERLPDQITLYSVNYSRVDKGKRYKNWAATEKSKYVSYTNEFPLEDLVQSINNKRSKNSNPRATFLKPGETRCLLKHEDDTVVCKNKTYAKDGRPTVSFFKMELNGENSD